MDRLRSVVLAGVVGSLLVAGAPPVAAADIEPPPMPPELLETTGLTEGEVVGQSKVLKPSMSGMAYQLEVFVNGVLNRTVEYWPTSIVVTPPVELNDTDADITVRATDERGRTAEATTRVHIDTAAPEMTFTPGLGAIVSGTTTITATGPDDVVQVVAESDDGEIGRATSAPWPISWDTRFGPELVRFVATDRAGNNAYFTGSFRVDNHGPVITPRFGDVRKRVKAGQNSMYAEVSDVSGVDRVQWWVDGAPVSAERLLTWDFGSRSRSLLVEVHAWDSWGNLSIVTSPLTIDPDGPRVTSIKPIANALVRGSRITSTLAASDPAGIQYATLSGAVTDRSAPYTSSIAAGSDGKRTLTWSVVDAVGNKATAARVVIVDNTKPKLKITKAPGNGAKVKGTVKVTASATDRNGVNRVELLVNGRVVAKDTRSAYSFSVDTARYGKKIKIVLRAYDRAGNVGTSTTRTWHR